MRKGKYTTKKSPKEIIENDKDSSTESIYIKFPGRPLENITYKNRRYGRVVPDIDRLNKLIKENQEKSHLDVHTHPYKTEGHNDPEEEIANCPIPSSGDIESFITNRKIRSMAVAQRDEKTGEVGGYVFLRKKKRYQKIPKNAKQNETERGAIWRYNNSEGCAEKTGSRKHRLEALKNLQNYDEIANYRFIPAKGYELDKDGTSFVKKKEDIEKIAKDSDEIRYTELHQRPTRYIDKLFRKELIILSFLVSLFFLSSNITGNVVGNLTNSTSNWIGAVLLVIGLVGVYFRVKK